MYPTNIASKRRRLPIAAFLAWALLAILVRDAHAERKVYLNGIDLADVDVRGHTFDGCTVRFDKEGNVHITVKGLQIGTTKAPEAGDGNPDGQEAAQAAYHYLVVKPVKERGDAYQMQMYINGAMVRRFGGRAQMQVHDITRYVKSGQKNEIRLVAAPVAARRAEEQPSDDLEIVLGEGVIENGMVVVKKPHVQYRQKKDDNGGHDRNYEFMAR